MIRRHKLEKHLQNKWIREWIVFPTFWPAAPTMRGLSLLLIPVLLLLLAVPASRARYNDDFDDGEDLADFDDNDFAEFEDMNEDTAAETETAPPPRASPASQPEEEEEDDEATVELEDGQDGFEDSETQVRVISLFNSASFVILPPA